MEDPNNPPDTQVGLNNVIIDLAKYYQRLISDLLPSKDIFGSAEDKRELKKLLDHSRLNFGQIKKLLAYVKSVRPDVNEIISFRTKIRTIHNKRQDLCYTLENNMNEISFGMKLPEIVPEISSYLMNTGNYNFLNLSVRGHFKSHIPDLDTFQEMDRVLKKKLSVALLPPDELKFDIKEGMLNIESTSLSFSCEVTLFYNQKRKDYDWFLVSFDHKLVKFKDLEKKRKKIQDDIVRVYKDGPPEQENYIISYIVHKIKYFYTRKKLKMMLKSAELLQQQIDQLGGSGEKFEITQRKVAKDIIYFEIDYWKESLFHSLNPQHKYNSLIFQLKNLSYPAFTERYQANDKSLFSGFDREDVLYLGHEPSLPSEKSFVDLFKFTNTHYNTMQPHVKKILLFGISKNVRLNGLSLNNTFFEIFEEVKTLFQLYQTIMYFSRLAKVDSKDIHLVCTESNEIYSDGHPLKQKKLYVTLEIEENAIYFFVNPLDGKIDIRIEPTNQMVEVHKNRFKEILFKDPLNFKEVIILYKKILLLNTFICLLYKDNLTIIPRIGAKEDNFKSVCFRTEIFHVNQTSNLFFRLTFTYTIVFDEEAKNVEIQTIFKSEMLHSNHQFPALKKTPTLSLTPFNLKLLTKKIAEVLKSLKYRGLFDHERGKSEEQKETDFENPISEVRYLTNQSFNTNADYILIVLRPSYPFAENLTRYIHSHQVFNPSTHRQRLLEVYEPNKLTIKYKSVFNSYNQLKKDIQRLEIYVANPHYRLTSNSSKEFEKHEYHSSSIMNFQHFLTFCTLNEVMDIETLPAKFKNFSTYHNSRDERELKQTRDYLLGEMKRILLILIHATDLNQKKNEYFARMLKQSRANGVEKDPKKEQLDKIFQHFYLHYYTDIYMLTPHHFSLFWRSYFNKTLISFRFDFQVIGDNEIECKAIHKEDLHSLEEEKMVAGDEAYQKNLPFYISSLFKLPASSSTSSFDLLQNSDRASMTLRLKLKNRESFISMVYEITRSLIIFSYSEMQKASRRGQ